MKDKISFWTVFVFAVFLIVFGYIGYLKSCSLMSFISGGISGVLLLISCLGMYQKKKWGMKAAMVISALLTIMFAIRGVISEKPLPMILTALSAVVLVLLLIRRK